MPEPTPEPRLRRLDSAIARLDRLAQEAEAGALGRAVRSGTQPRLRRAAALLTVACLLLAAAALAF